GALAYRHGGRRAFLAQAVEQVVAGQEHWVVHHLTLAGHDLLDRLRQESAAAAVPVRKSA
ncbi:hypothetical protein, partial [Pseudomonas aeruginosa]|uniref:hypothetical protein n=1 Tax=Pseudomonas aeruginosa TaxID=287 RepID=UPI001A9F44A8